MKVELEEQLELNAYLESGSIGAANHDHRTEHIVRDLVQSRGRLIGTYILGSFLGYLLSLLFCEQCEIGFSELSHTAAHHLHSIPDPWCAFVCGSLYGLSPALLILGAFSRFQFRYILFKMPLLVVMVPITGSFLITFFGEAKSTLWQWQWLGAALLVPYVFFFLSALRLRQRRVRKPEF